jgi:CBS domain-containing protein
MNFSIKRGNAPITEIFVSNILRLPVAAAGSTDRQLIGRPVDLTIGALDVDYPEISHLILRTFQAGQRGDHPARLALPWEAVDRIDWDGRRILVSDPGAAGGGAAQAVDAMGETFAQAVHLRRDILDAFIIDLQNRRVTRANDLLLEDGDRLRLRAADTGMRAVVRRLSRGLYHSFREYELQDWKHVEFLRGDPKAVQAGARYHRRIERLTPGEIANLAERLPYPHAAELVLLLPGQLAADTLELMTTERQLQLFEEFEEETALRLLEKMAPDIAADLIGRLTPDRARQTLDHLPKACSERIVELLRYPEGTVGSIMTNDVIAIPAALTVGEARERLRKALQQPDFVYFLYVVEGDENRRLRGVLSLRNILVARDDQRLEEIMNPYLATLSPLDSPQQAAYHLINSQIAALPVVGENGQLLGAVTVDAAVSQVAPGPWRTQAPRVFS